MKLALIFGLCSMLVTPMVFAGSSCEGLSGTYTLKTRGMHFVALLGTYTNRITFNPAASTLEFSSNWGPDFKIILNSGTHTVSEAGNQYTFGRNISGDADEYISNLNTVTEQLTQIQMLKVREGKSDPQGSQALSCAIEKVSEELAYARTQKFVYDQQGKLQIQKVTDDVTLNKTVTVNVNQQPQPSPDGAGQKKAQ